MTEFKVRIYNKSNVPVGYIMIYLVDYSDGNMLPASSLDQSDKIAWDVSSFPVKYKWLSKFGNLLYQLNQYRPKDDNSYPVSFDEAIALTEKFAAKLTSISHLWEDLAIRWPDIYLLAEDKLKYYFVLVIIRYDFLDKSIFNHQHFQIDKKPFDTIAWDLLLRNMLMSLHENPYETTQVNNKTEHAEANHKGGEQSKFISFEEISKHPPMLNEIFQFTEIHINLSNILNKVLTKYEIDEDLFLEAVDLNYDYDRSTARFIFIPLGEICENSGVFMLLEGNQTKHIYFNICVEDLEDFIHNARFY